MLVFNVEKSTIKLDATERLASGAVKVYDVRFSFDGEWGNMEKTAVFKAGDIVASVLLDGTSCEVPASVLENFGCTLQVGVYGTNSDGEVLPTTWCNVGTIREGVIPGEVAVDPPESVYQQFVSRNEQVADRAETARNDALEAAIRSERAAQEAADILDDIKDSGGGGGTGGSSIALGHALHYDGDGRLSVVVSHAPEMDNTLPITSAAVATSVGNIEVLLGTI